MSDLPRSGVLNEHDFYLLKEGTHCRLYDVLGCHLRDGGARVAVWAPNARQVSVIGDFNGWDPRAHPLGPRGDSSGIWEVEVPGLVHGGAYKFRITPQQGEAFDKADPFAFAAEEPPRTASRAWSLDVAWNDADWMNRRAQRNGLGAPISIYEVHLGSWRRRAGRWLSYRELAVELSRYVLEMGFTRVELLPVCEHPFYGSWGYQTTGFFAPTARYGPPQDLMFLVDTLHQHGIGVPLDRVPSRCPDDPHGLSRFDGTALFEHDDPRQGFHPDWHSSIFNYGRHEVRAFLLWPTSGSTTTTSTACGWTPWPRCSTSTTGGSRASGFRTGTAARKTSRPSSSCGSSTPRCTGTMPAC